MCIQKAVNDAEATRRKKKEFLLPLVGRLWEGKYMGLRNGKKWLFGKISDL